VLAGVRGAFDVGGTLSTAEPHDSQLRHAVDADLASARSFAAAVTVSPSPALRLALSYRHQARIVQRIEGELSGAVGSPPFVLPARYRLDTVVVPAAYPRLVALAASYRAGNRLRLGAELHWENFADWPGPDEASNTSLLLADVPAELGSGSAPAAAKPTPFNRVVPRVGTEYTLPLRRASKLRLRAGYVFERSPLPAQRTTRWLDSDRHTLTVGSGFEAAAGPGLLRFDAYGLVTVMPERSAVLESELGVPRRASGLRFGFGLGSSYGF
jgi:long-chain fatty acid transport protein